MALRIGIFFTLIVALCAVAFFGITVAERSTPHPVALAPVTEQVLVASGNLQAGGLLQPGDLSSAAVPIKAVPASATIDTPAGRSGLVGAMIRTPIASGSAILNNSVIRPGDHGFLAAVLAPGMRAATIGVDEISGADGLIWPGDHVDVLLTQSLNDPTVPLGKQIAAELVLADVRVIATGQQLVQGQVAENAEKAQQLATTVTLEVTPLEAERCAVASRLGPLSLVVHSSESGGPAQASAVPPAPVWADEVSPALSAVHSGGSVIATVHVFNGATDSEDFKF